MIRKIVLILILLITAGYVPVFASGNSETPGAGALTGGIEEYESGNLAGAASGFRQAAASDDPGTAAAGYYNYGTVQAELARQSQDPSEKRLMLEESYQSLKRAAELGQLPADVQKQAYRNMEIVREQLSQLPETASEGQDGQDGDPQDGQDSQDGDPQDGQGSESQDGQDGQPKEGQGAQSPAEMLEQQRGLTDRTEGGEGTDAELADEQKQLQKASESAGLNDAAVNQARAAEALSQGDRESASDYQKAAEESLAAAAKAEEDENGSSEADDILNQEAENKEQRNRLDNSGGITDAERNW